ERHPRRTIMNVMRGQMLVGVVVTTLVVAGGTTAGAADDYRVTSQPDRVAADDSKVKEQTDRVQQGAKEIGHGNVGEGVKDTAKGIGGTVEEGAKYTGDKLKESGQAAEPTAKNAWEHVKSGATDFGHSVKNFFTKLFNKD